MFARIAAEFDDANIEMDQPNLERVTEYGKMDE